MTRSLTIFARQPVAGRTKTRLCPPLDGETAAALYTCFLRDVLDMAAQLDHVHTAIAHTPDSDPAFFASFAPNMAARSQRGATLGERMDHALREALPREIATEDTERTEVEDFAPASVFSLSSVAKSAAVIIGSDSPDLPAAFVHEAFARLEAGADVVLGPASDGGYYLIGARKPQPRLVREVPMSTPTVLKDTLALANELGLNVYLLPEWHDIDTVDDLRALEERLRAAPEHVAPATRAFLLNMPLIPFD